MAKFLQFVLVVVAITTVCLAEPIRFRGNRKNKFLARQEEAPSSTAAPAPYPPAGVTPAIVFELPTEQTTVQPDNTYLPPAPEPTPDNVYGPPEPEPTPENVYGPPQPEPTPENVYGPPEPEPTPDNTYGPPAAEQVPAVDAGSEDVPVIDPRIERLILAARNQLPSQLRQQRKRAQPLRAAKLQSKSVEIVRSQPVIAYSVQYKSF